MPPPPLEKIWQEKTAFIAAFAVSTANATWNCRLLLHLLGARSSPLAVGGRKFQLAHAQHVWGDLDTLVVAAEFQRFF